MREGGKLRVRYGQQEHMSSGVYRIACWPHLDLLVTNIVPPVLTVIRNSHCKYMLRVLHLSLKATIDPNCYKDSVRTAQ